MIRFNDATAEKDHVRKFMREGRYHRDRFLQLLFIESYDDLFFRSLIEARCLLRLFPPKRHEITQRRVFSGHDLQMNQGWIDTHIARNAFEHRARRLRRGIIGIRKISVGGNDYTSIQYPVSAE